MAYSNPTHFKIDLGDIYRFEANRFSSLGKNLECFKKFHYDIMAICIASDIQPFITPKTVEDGKHKQDYYDRRYAMAQQEYSNDIYPYFAWDGNIYDMQTSCCISRKETNKQTFQWLFGLKLSQYSDALIYLREFLSYHLTNTFDGKREEYYEFLQILIVQFDDLIDKKVCDGVAKLISKQGLLQEWEDENHIYEHLISELRTIISQKDFVSDEPENNKQLFPDSIEAPTSLPAGYKSLPGNFSTEQIKYFFSFLYKEISEQESPFLSKEATEDIFRNGLTIPSEVIQAKLYKLNVSKRYPKGIIEYAIHTFYELHAANNYKKHEVLRFFCYYFKDFAWALESENAYRNFISNITGQKPKKMNFDLKKYIPSEFHNIAPIPARKRSTNAC